VISTAGHLTPVTFALHEASRGATEPPRSFLERGNRSLRVVAQIVDGLYAFARSYAAPNRSAHCEVRGVVENVIADATHDADAADVRLALGTVSDVVVACDDGVLASVLSNLVRKRNSLHGDAGRSVASPCTCEPKARGRSSSWRMRAPGLPRGFEGRVFLPYSRPVEEKRSGLAHIADFCLRCRWAAGLDERN
jgi:light-regulated signal transduction histidine kinase (bacteriophytochrome)